MNIKKENKKEKRKKEAKAGAYPLRTNFVGQKIVGSGNDGKSTSATTATWVWKQVPTPSPIFGRMEAVIRIL